MIIIYHLGKTISKLQSLNYFTYFCIYIFTQEILKQKILILITNFSILIIFIQYSLTLNSFFNTNIYCDIRIRNRQNQQHKIQPFMFVFKEQTPKSIKQEINRFFQKHQEKCQLLRKSAELDQIDNVIFSFHNDIRISQMYYENFRSNLKFISTSYQNQIHWRNPQNDGFFPKQHLLIEVSYIKFQNLLKLTFQVLDFNNVEPLTWLNSPLLRNLTIAQNNDEAWNRELRPSFSIKPLAKMNLKNLQICQITQYQNHSNYQTQFPFNRMRKNKYINQFYVHGSNKPIISYAGEIKSQATTLRINYFDMKLSVLFHKRAANISIELYIQRFINVLNRRFKSNYQKLEVE